jgi:hypothetical protein
MKRRLRVSQAMNRSRLLLLVVVPTLQRQEEPPAGFGVAEHIVGPQERHVDGPGKGERRRWPQAGVAKCRAHFSR